MNYFEISPDKLLKVLSPFENNYSEYNFLITKLDIDDFDFNKVNFNTDDEKTNLITKIIFLIKNPTKIKSCEFDFNKSNQESFVIKEIENLYASIFLGKNICFATEQDVLDVKKIFKDVSLIKYTNTIDIFNWEFLEEEKTDFQKFFDLFQNKKSSAILKEFAEVLSKTVWGNSEFLEEFKKTIVNQNYLTWKDAINIIPEDCFFTEKIYLLLKDAPNADISLYQYLIKRTRVSDIDFLLEKDFYNNKENIFKLLDFHNNFLKSDKYRAEEDLSNKKFIPELKKINKEIMNSYDFLEKLPGQNLMDFYYILEDKTLNDENIQSLFFKKAYYSLNTQIHGKLFNWVSNKDKVINFLKTYGKIIKVMDVNIYSLLNMELKKDKELCNVFLDLNNDFFKEFPVECQKDKDLIKKYILNNGDLSFINKEYIFKHIMREDKELFKFICLKNNYFLLHDRCLKEFSENVELVKNIGFFDFPVDKISKICKKDEDYDVLLKKDINFYYFFPDKQKYDFALSFIKRIKSNSNITQDNIESIPKRLWWDEAFVINVLNEFPKVLLNIKDLLPKEMWESRVFILKVCELLDEREVSIRDLPYKIKTFFENNNVNNSFKDFMNSIFAKNTLADLPVSNNKNKIKI